jgi:hypothetical protein
MSTTASAVSAGVAVPKALVGVTRQSSECVPSPTVGVYVLVVAPETMASSLYHW